MAIRVQVMQGEQIITPIRFGRAIVGEAQADAPEVDDQGFTMGQVPATWGNKGIRGAKVGIAEGDTVRIRVRMEDLDTTGSVPLFVVSTDTDVVEVIEPEGGGPLPSDGIFRILGVRDFKNRPVSVQVRLGGVDGPALGRLEPHVFQLRTLRLCMHLVSINGVATARNAATLEPVMEQVNAVWRPCGIRFVYVTRVTPVNNFAVAGQVTTNMNTPTSTKTAADWAEFSRLINTNFDRTRINVYCVQKANQVAGLAYDNSVARPNGYGMIVVDDTRYTTFAHELGHYLSLGGHANDIPGSEDRRDDIGVRRRVMYHRAGWHLVNTDLSYRNDVGYGDGNPGAFFAVKNLPNDPLTNELARARRRSLNPY